MIHFQRFETTDFDLLKSWITSEKELIQFAGPIFTFPVTDDQLEKYCASNKREVFKIVLDETSEVIGHCEFNYENELPRISRVLIGDEKARNRGIGTEIIKKMSEAFFSDSAVSKIDLNVFAWNDRAIHCYENLGFRINTTTLFELEVEGKFWENHNMVLTREDFNKNQR
ncbi:MAG: GNAT family protein [Crocinitomicaceae bacterium]